MRILSKVISVIFVIGAVILIGGCGKVSSPDFVSGSGYPHEYPHK